MALMTLSKQVGMLMRHMCANRASMGMVAYIMI